jgi:hypothetical protein
MRYPSVASSGAGAARSDRAELLFLRARMVTQTSTSGRKLNQELYKAETSVPQKFLTRDRSYMIPSGDAGIDLYVRNKRRVAACTLALSPNLVTR